MTDQQMEFIINTLYAKQDVTPLEKDILDTWREIHKKPMDMNSAFNQMRQNEASHPDVLAKVRALPTTGQKRASDLTTSDVSYVLNMQLGFLIEKKLRK